MLTALMCAAFAALAVSAGAVVPQGNLLANPGAEEGTPAQLGLYAGRTRA